MRTTRPLQPIPQVYLLSHDKSQQIHPALPHLLNKKIKDIKRAGFGMYDFDNFRKRILLSLGAEHVVDEFYAIHKKRAEALCNEALNGGNAHD